MKNTRIPSSRKLTSAHCIPSRVLFCSLVAAALLAGCAEPAKEIDQDKLECEKHEDCTARQDGKTECDLTNHVCTTPAAAPRCGDGVLDAGESCDGSSLNNKSCTDFSEYVGGTLSCNATCEFDKSGCFECTDTDKSRCASGEICLNHHCHTVICGDSKVEDGEECDGSNLNGKNCADIDRIFIGGTPQCDECVFDTSLCYECTDDPDSCGEGKVCKNGSCATVKPVCGDGKLNQDDESCDKDELDGKSCKSFSEYVGGTLACNNSCSFDKSGCWECTTDDTSKCPNTDMVCSDEHRCVPKGHVITCGDNLAEGDDEPCDGTDLRDQTCADFVGFADGTLRCVSCQFNTANCFECTKDDHCAGHSDGKTECKVNVCSEPEIVPIQSDVVISQIYPGAGNTDALYKIKYVELFNRGNDSVDISNWSIQYGAPKNTKISSSCVIPNKTAPLPKGGYFLIALTKTGTNGEDIPTADYTCTSSMSAGAKSGKFILVNHSEKLSTSSPESGYMDAIGYGGKDVNWAEETAAPALSNSTAALRNHGGCDDTNNNFDDFTVGVPSPRNSASPLNDCSAPNDLEESIAACSDKRDNDGDGKIDCDDFGCQPFDICRSDENTKEACSDKKDNDKDGYTDCNDPDCADFCILPENTHEACIDTKDNDKDGYTDCDDPGCADFCILPENTREACSDTKDNDKDGQTDCNDPDCADFCSTPENTREACNDTKDNDKDGQTDCDDPDCASFCAPTCNSNQQYVAKYNVCAYKITSATDLINLRDKWNSSSATAYPETEPAFVLTNDINLGTKSNWIGIGNADNPFRGIIIGNDHDISGTLNCTDTSCGLFTEVNNAKFYDLSVSVNVSLTKNSLDTELYAGGLVSNAHPTEQIVIKNLITNVEVSLSNEFVSNGKAKRYDRYLGCVFAELNGGHLEMSDSNIQCKMRSNIKGLINENHNVYAGSFTSRLTGYYASIAATMMKASADIRNIQIDFYTTDLKLDGDAFSGGVRTYWVKPFSTFGGFFGEAEGLSETSPIVMDRSRCTIKDYDLGNISHSENTLSGPLAGTIKNAIVTNFRVTPVFSECKGHGCKRMTSVIAAIVENCKIANFDVSSLIFDNLPGISYSIKNDNIINGYISGLERGNYGNEYPVSNYYSMLYSSIESTYIVDETRKILDATDYTAAQVVSFFNNSLSSKHEFFAPGKYLPWFVDSNGKATLNFDATEANMYTIP